MDKVIFVGVYFLGFAFMSFGILGAVDWSRRKESGFLSVFYIVTHFFSCFTLSFVYYMICVALTVLVYPELSNKTINELLFGTNDARNVVYAVVAVILAIKTVDCVPQKGVK